MLKGGFTVAENTKAHLYISSDIIGADILIDSVSLKGFTKAEWQEHWNENIEQVRKRSISIHVTSKGKNLPGASISISQTRARFTIGGATTASILDNKAYQDWFMQRFQAVVFNNEMKWYYTEYSPGKENYRVTDAMVSFFKKHEISIRGHAVLLAAPSMIQPWLYALPPQQVKEAAERHVRSVVRRYSSDVIAWDVLSENMHFSFYEDKLGQNASAMFYRMVRSLDSEHPLFLNEFNTLEYPLDLKVIPSRYVERIQEIQSFLGNKKTALSIGLQGHFPQKPKLSYIRAALDILGATGFPIWLTELDVERGPDQAAELEQVMREAFSHPAVEGIIVWGGWKPTNCNQTCLSNKDYNEKLPSGCAEMCLVDSAIKNLPPGDVVDKLLKEWRTSRLTGITNKDGMLKETVFLGEYSVRYSHPRISRPGEKIVRVARGEGTLELNIDV